MQIFWYEMQHSFLAKTFPALAALTSLSDITSNSKLTSVFRKVTDLFDTQARLATFLARNVTLFFSLRFFPALATLTVLSEITSNSRLAHFLENEKLRFKQTSQKFRKLNMLKFILNFSNPTKGFNFFSMFNVLCKLNVLLLRKYFCTVFVSKI